MPQSTLGGLCGAVLASAVSLSPCVAGAGESGLPEVRLTPPVVAVDGLEAHRVTLDGAWRFLKDVPESFDGTIASTDEWEEAESRQHFAFQGFGRMHRQLGVPVAWARNFEVPEAWEGRRIVLRFDSLDGDSAVWVNGQRVGGADLAYLPIEFDVTDVVRVGERNEVALTLARSYFTAWCGREMGGLLRPVFLQALPSVHLSRLRVTTDFDESYEDATLRLDVVVQNTTDAVASPQLRVMLRDVAGEAIALAEDRFLLRSVDAGQSASSVVEVPVSSPKHWHAETPNLYTLTAALLIDGEEQMRVERTVGFREVEVDGHRLLVNGAPLKVWGANQHVLYPGMDHAVPADLLRSDLKVLMELNINYIRPYPTPAQPYVDAANELGVFLSAEPALSGMLYWKGPDGDRGQNPVWHEPFRFAMATMLEAYGSEPSVIIWSLANECPYYDVFAQTALDTKAADPSRPVIFSSDQRKGINQPELDLNDDHYPRGGTVDVSVKGMITGGHWDDMPTDKPNLFTEWLHVNRTNPTELAYDPGIEDFWGIYAKAHAEYTWAHGHIVGGCVFNSVPTTGLHNYHPWGLVDDQRRPKDIAWHFARANAPLKVLSETADPVEDVASIRVQNRFAVTDLAELTLRYAHGSRAGELQPRSVKPGRKGRVQVPVDRGVSEPLRLEFVSPKGYVVEVAELPVVWTDAVSAAPDAVKQEFAPLQTEECEERVSVSGDGFVVTVDRQTGGLVASVSGAPVIVDGPNLVVRRSGWTGHIPGNHAVVNVPSGWSASSVSVAEIGDGGVEIEVRGVYEQAEGAFSYVVEPDGNLAVGYDFEWTAEVGLDGQQTYEVGLSFGVPRELDRLSWRRDGLWSVYPPAHIGRPVGDTLATGDPRWADMRNTMADGERKPWPQSQDLLDGLTRDFRSTKTRVHEAALLASTGVGVRVVSDGKQSVRVSPHDQANDRFALHVLDFYRGGTELHLVKSVSAGRFVVQQGTALNGTAVLRLLD